MFVWRSPITVYFSKPVCICISSRVHVPLVLCIRRWYCGYFTGLVIQNTLHDIGTEYRTLTGIGCCRIKVLCKLVRIHHFRYLQSIRKTDITWITYAGFTGFSTFRFNQNHTERSTWTINRRSSSIFQNWNRFDIIRVNCIHVSFDTIYQYQRFWTGTVTDSTSTTYIEIHFIVKCTTTGIYWKVQTRNNPLQSLRHILYRARFEHFCINHTDRPCQVYLFLCTETNNNDFIKSLCIFFKYDFNRALSCVFYLLANITNKRYLDQVSFFNMG